MLVENQLRPLVGAFSPGLHGSSILARTFAVVQRAMILAVDKAATMTAAAGASTGHSNGTRGADHASETGLASGGDACSTQSVLHALDGKLGPLLRSAARASVLAWTPAADDDTARWARRSETAFQRMRAEVNPHRVTDAPQPSYGATEGNLVSAATALVLSKFAGTDLVLSDTHARQL